MSNSYLLFDAARAGENTAKAKELNEDHSCLYRGSSVEKLADVAPYLFTLSKDSDFSDWYKTNGWGDAWGLLVQTQLAFAELYNHFRRFLMIKTTADKELYFRFYDPRVLKIFLPTCDSKQIKEFFGAVDYFIVEGDIKEEGIRFWQKDGVLNQEILPLEKIF